MKYTDATVIPRGRRVSFLSPSHPKLCIHAIITPKPIYYAIEYVSVLQNAMEAMKPDIYIDSLGAVNELKKFTKTFQICQQIHRLKK